MLRSADVVPGWYSWLALVSPSISDGFLCIFGCRFVLVCVSPFPVCLALNRAAAVDLPCTAGLVASSSSPAHRPGAALGGCSSRLDENLLDVIPQHMLCLLNALLSKAVVKMGAEFQNQLSQRRCTSAIIWISARRWKKPISWHTCRTSAKLRGCSKLVLRL